MPIPVQLEIFMKDLTKAGLQSVGKNVDGVENQTRQLIAALNQVIASQKHQMEVNKAAGMSYTQEAANIQALTGQVRGLEAGLKSLNKTQQETTATQPKIDIDTDAVERKTGNLKMQFAQVARELPSLAMGPQMFILAVSNNLPMLADAIADVRKQNELLAASGKKGVPVWKQMAGAVFSWQTALIAAISLGIVYGKEIGNWVKELVKGKDAMADFNKTQEALNKVQTDATKGAAEETARLRTLYAASQDVTKPMKERNKAVDALQKMYPSYFGNLSNEEVLTGKASSAYARLSASILSAARAKAAMTRMTEEQGKILENEQKINDAYARREQLEAKAGKLAEEEKNAPHSPYGNVGMSMAWKKVQDEMDAVDKEIAGYRAAIRLSAKISKELEKSVQVDDLTGSTQGGSSSPGAKTDYASQLADARIKAQQTTEKLRLQIMMDGIAKRKAAARQEYDENLADIDKLERDTLARMDKARKQGDVIPDSQYESVKETARTNRLLAEQVYNEQIFQIEQQYRDKSAQALIDYYKEYGTYQEKRLAIAGDYAKRIANAETEGERMTLAKERDKEIQTVDFEELKKGMDWQKLFGDLDRVSEDTLEALRHKLKDYLESIGDDISPESFKEVMDAFDNMDAELADRSPFKHLKKGYADYMDSLEEVRKAESLLNQVWKAGSIIVEELEEETGELTRKLITQADAEKQLADAQDKKHSAQKKITDSVNSIGEKGQAVVKAGNDIVDMLGSFGVEMPEALTGALNGVGTVMDSLAEMDLTKPFSVLTGVTGVLKGIGQTIGSLFGLGGADYSGYENMKSKYEGLIDIWDSLISKKQQYIDIDYGIEAKKAAEEAKKLVDTQISRQRQLAEALMGAGKSAGSHSLGYRVNDRMGGADWQRLSALTGSTVREVADVFRLDADVIGKVLQDEKFVSVLTTVNSEFITYIENIEKYGEQLEEIAEQEKEAFTGTSFDDFRSSFVDMLSDLDSTNEDFAKNFEGYLQKAIFSSLIANKYKDRIKSLYDSWASDAESGGKLDSTEAANLQHKYQQMVNELLAERDKLMNDFGWKTEEKASSQSPGSGALTTMSQDSISRFEGIGRNMQTHLANMDSLIKDIRETQRLDSQTLATIAKHTAYLVLMYDIMEDMKINGIKMK